MFSIFVVFITESNSSIKAIAFSFAVGVLLDAFIVQLTLVPAVMSITGSRIWYHPQWFARHVAFVGEPDPSNPIGAKGIGELGLVGIAAAIANAVYHATGRRIRSVPITISRLL